MCWYSLSVPRSSAAVQQCRIYGRDVSVSVQLVVVAQDRVWRLGEGEEEGQEGGMAGSGRVLKKGER